MLYHERDLNSSSTKRVAGLHSAVYLCEILNIAFKLILDAGQASQWSTMTAAVPSTAIRPSEIVKNIAQSRRWFMQNPRSPRLVILAVSHATYGNCRIRGKQYSKLWVLVVVSLSYRDKQSQRNSHYSCNDCRYPRERQLVLAVVEHISR